MQTGNEQLRRQQEIMQLKGFYNGRLDGVWGPKTVEAKKKWEMHTSFAPGLPNFGLPFANKGPYPKGITVEKETGFLTCAELIMRQEQAAKKPTTAPNATKVEDEDADEE